MKNLAIIPARSGSKGLRDKNIRKLNKKPLLAYSIAAAKESGMFDEVMVSTDSELYAQIAKKYGASVPFIRSEKNSSDTADTWSAVKEVLGVYEQKGVKWDTVCLLQPTSPLRRAEDLVKAFQIYEEKNAIVVVSVCETEHSPLLCGHLTDGGGLDGFVARENLGRRQSVEPFYRINGAIYIVKADELLQDTFLYREGSYAYIMDKNRSVDIDTIDDFLYAEFLLNLEKQKEL